MNLLAENQLNCVSAGYSSPSPITTVMPFEGDRTFMNGFWNGASATAPMLGYCCGAIASFVLFPLDLLGFVDINSHLQKNKNTVD